MFGSKNVFSVFGHIIFVVVLLAALAWLRQPAAAQTPPTEVWFNYFSPGEITHLAVAGDDVWAATYSGLSYGLIHWNRVTGQYTEYSSSNGLPEGEIIDLTLDPAGRPWVDGLSYLDGERWVPGMEHGVNDLVFTDDSAVSGAGVWIASAYYGISFFKGQPSPGVQATFTFTDELSVEEPTVVVLDQAGRPWVGGQGGVSYFDGQGWINYTVESGLPAQPVTTLVFDPTGQPWVGTAGGGVSRLNPGGSPDQTWTTFTLKDGLASNWITAIAFDVAGQPWVGTIHSGVSHLNETEDGQAHWTNYTVSDGLAGNVIDTIFIDATDQPWVVTRNDGISTFDGRQWRTYPYPGDLAGGWVTATTLDETGQMWIGQANGRVSQLVLPEQAGPPSWITYGTTGPASNYIGAVALDPSGHLWVGTKAGVSVLNGQTWTSYDEEDGLVDNDVTALAADLDGSLWFGTPQGISHFDGQHWTNYPMGTINPFANKVQAIAIDPEGGKWFGRPIGLTYFDGQDWITYTVESGLASNDVKAIAVEAPGHLWLGTSGGVSQLVLADSGITTWTTYTVEDGLPSNAVSAVAIDSAGNKWFGTSSGLTKFDGQSWTTYTEADGLVDNRSSALAFDEAGHLWVGHQNGGVTEFDGQNWIVHSMTLRVTGLATDPAGPVWVGTDIEGLRALVDASQAAALAPSWKPVQTTPSAVTSAASNVPAQVVPPPAQLSPTAPPAQPLRAWAVAPDGAVFVLDAANVLYQLAPTDLAPLAQSQPLFNSQAGDRLYLLADSQQLFVGHMSMTQTLVLDRADFSEITRLPQAGQMALEFGRQLFLIPEGIAHPFYTGEFWAYDLADLEQPPRQGSTPTCISGPPVTEPLHRHLYLQTRNCDGSSPHQRDYYFVYDLDTFAPLEGTEVQDPGYLDRPAMAVQADILFTVYHEANQQDHPMVLDLQGQELETGPSIEGYGSRPVTDPEGQWLCRVSCPLPAHPRPTWRSPLRLTPSTSSVMAG